MAIIRMFFNIKIILILMFLSPLNAQQTIRIVVDGSASMKGYFKTKEINQIVDQIQQSALANQLKTNIQLFYSPETPKGQEAIVEWKEWGEWDENIDKNSWGAETHLNKALGVASKNAAMLFMITDNFQDDGISQSNSIELGNSNFYQSIREQGFDTVHFLPLFLKFDGNIDLYPTQDLSSFQNPTDAKKLVAYLKEKTSGFDPNESKIGIPKLLKFKDKKPFWKLPYVGKRGVAIYIFLSQNVDKDLFSKLIKKFAEYNQEVRKNIFLIHPIGEDTFNLENLKNFKPKDIANQCGQKLNDLKDKKTNTILEPQKELSYPYQLVIDEKVTDRFYDPRKSGNISFALQVVFSAKQIQMNSSVNPCDSNLEIKLTNFKISSQVSNLLVKNIETLEIKTSSYPKKLVIEENKKQASAFVEINIPPIVQKHINNDILKKADIVGSFELALKVPKNMISLADTYKNFVFTTNPSDLSKIYSSEDILNYLIPSSQSYFVVKMPISIEKTVWDKKEKPIPPVEAPIFPYVIAGVLLLLTLLNQIILPFGFDVVVKYSNHKKARHFKLGGLFYYVPFKSYFIEDQLILKVRRSSNFSKKLDFMDEKDHIIAQINSKGKGFILFGDQTKKIEWLDESKVSTLKSKNLIDEEK